MNISIGKKSFLSFTPILLSLLVVGQGIAWAESASDKPMLTDQPIAEAGVPAEASVGDAELNDATETNDLTTNTDGTIPAADGSSSSKTDAAKDKGDTSDDDGCSCELGNTKSLQGTFLALGMFLLPLVLRRKNR